MRFFSCEIIVETEPADEGYLAHDPTLPGCFSNGKTIGPRISRSLTSRPVALSAPPGNLAALPLDTVPHPWQDGTSHLVFEPLDLLALLDEAARGALTAGDEVRARPGMP